MANYVHRPQRLGPGVLISAGWYYTLSATDRVRTAFLADPDGTLIQLDQLNPPQ